MGQVLVPDKFVFSGAVLVLVVVVVVVEVKDDVVVAVAIVVGVLYFYVFAQNVSDWLVIRVYSISVSNGV